MEGVVTAAGVETGLLLPDKTSQTSFTGPVAGSPSDSDSSASFHTAASDTSFTCGREMEEDPQQHGCSGAKTTPSDTAMDANDDVIGNAGGYTPSNEVMIGGAVGGVLNGGGKFNDSPADTSDTATQIAQPTATDVQERVSVVQSEDPRHDQQHTVEWMCRDGSEVVKQPSGEMVEQLDSVNQGERRSDELVRHSSLATNGEVDTSEDKLHRVVELGDQTEAGDGLVSSVGGALPRPPTVEEREGEAMEYQNQVGEAMHHNEEDTFEEAGKQTASQQPVVKREDEEPMETAVHETTDNTRETVEVSKTEKEDSSSKSYGKFEKPPLEEEEGGRGEGESASSVSSSGYGGSREASPEEVGGVITEDMKEEEKRLKERESREQSVGEEVGDLSQMKEYQRYMRLQHLLQKSSIYSKFLLERMENQVQEKKVVQEKKTNEGKKKPGRAAAGKDCGESTEAQSRRRSTRSSKKRKAEEPIELSRFMDNKGKLKQMKLDKGGGVSEAVDTSSSKKTATPDENGTEKERKPVPVAQPQLMTGGIMRPYQVEGMEWIKVLYENGVNGILADEMGLGKTLQVIGVIAHLIEMGVKGPFLVAAPLSTLPNWVSEFKKFTPKIPVILYHGSQQEREKMRRKMFSLKRKSGELDTLPVVVTSYEICMRDQRHLMYRKWRFLVVDEGHRIKNLNCKLIRALKSYDAANRLLLTGTPLQNNLAELWSLLNFILPDIFDDLNGFQSWFDFDVSGEETREKIIAQEREQNVLSTLHQILTPFLLRRLKTDVEFSLPPKKEVVVYAPLTSVQQKYYTSLLDRTIMEMVKGKSGDGSALEDSTLKPRIRTSRSKGYAQLSDDQFESLLSGDKSYEELVKPEDDKNNKLPLSKRSVTNIKLTNVWMMLRKCCNHPYLLEFPMTSDGEFRIDEDLVSSCGKMMILDRLLPPLITRGHKTIIFSQFTTMLDLLADYMDLRSIGYGRLDGQMQFGERQTQMAVFQGDPDCMVFLTSTRAGGLGINLTAADTVIIYDSDWNPQADLQAQDRCHRIGQTKPVMVYRLVTANTFDQRIVERANSKRRLEKMVIHKGKFKGYSGEDQQLSLEDLVSLLQSADHETVVDSSDAIISDKALEALLDRSVATSGEREVGQGHSGGVFKVIHEQSSSGNNNTTLPSIHTSTASEAENKSINKHSRREEGGRDVEQNGRLHEQDSLPSITDCTASEAENRSTDKDKEEGGREGEIGEQETIDVQNSLGMTERSITDCTASEAENRSTDKDKEEGGREGEIITNCTASEAENRSTDKDEEEGGREGEIITNCTTSEAQSHGPPPATENSKVSSVENSETVQLPHES